LSRIAALSAMACRSRVTGSPPTGFFSARRVVRSDNVRLQIFGRGEGGFRVSGRAVTVELYLALERVIDPYPTEHGTASYASVGMRLLSR